MNARHTGWLFAGLLVGCADAPVPTQPPPPPLPPSDRVEVLELWTGERQVGLVGSQLSQSFRVRASASGVPVSGLEVQWSVEGSTVPVTSTLTDTSGVTG